MEQAPVIERALIDDEDVPDPARSISVSIDRVSVPMEEPRERPVGRPRRGAPKNPITRAYRMGYVGTRLPPRLRGPRDSRASLRHDAGGRSGAALRGSGGRRAAPSCEEASPAADALVRRRAGDVEPARLRSLTERPSGAAASTAWSTSGTPSRSSRQRRRSSSRTTRTSLRARWKLRLLNASTARAEILRELRASDAEHVVVGDARRQTRPRRHHLPGEQRGTHGLRPREEVGLPIGSGNVEATCKSLVNLRMNRSGSRWKIDTGERVLHLRALVLSDRWTEAMDITLRPERSRVRVAA